jgi:hypothetical protein
MTYNPTPPAMVVRIRNLDPDHARIMYRMYVDPMSPIVGEWIGEDKIQELARVISHLPRGLPIDREEPDTIGISPDLRSAARGRYASAQGNGTIWEDRRRVHQLMTGWLRLGSSTWYRGVHGMNPENQELIPQLIAYQGEMELYLSRLYQDPNTNWEQVWARGRYRPLGILITSLFETRIDREGPYLRYPDGYRRDDWLNMGDRREAQALAILGAQRANTAVPHPLLGTTAVPEGADEEKLLMRLLLARPTTLAALIWPPPSVQIEGFG